MHKLTDEEFLEVINMVCAQEKHSHVNFTDMTDLSQELSSTGLDSLGVMMFFVLLDEVFGIPEDAIEEDATAKATTGHEIFEFIKENQTKGFTLDEVKEIAKQYS